MQDIKNENRVVSDSLLYYPERLRQHEEQLATVTFISSPSLSDDIQGTGGTSDPTARVAGQRLKYDSEWFSLIADVERSLPEKQRVFLQVRREALNIQGGGRGKPAWVSYVQCKYPLAMSQKTMRPVECYYISTPSIFYSWWNKIVEYTVRKAIRRGLL